MHKLFRLFIFLALFLTAGVLAYADSPSSALDDKPSVDTAASSSDTASSVQVPPVPSDTTTTGSMAPAGNAVVAGNTTQVTGNTSYLYDLKKLIEKSRENIKEVNEKIKEQSVLKRNQKREEKAREYYEKGVALTNEGKLSEARDYFEKAILITEHPEMAGYIRQSERRLARQENALNSQEREHFHQIKEDEATRKQDVETAYKEAVALYKQKKFHPAKDAFEHVEEIAPDYRATASYLKIIDQDIIMSDAQAAKQQAVEIADQQKEAEEARAKEKAMWLQQIEEKEKEHKEAINKQAADVYDEAIRLYKHKKFAEAKKKFEEVSWVIPDYKDTMKYLRRIDRDAEDEEKIDAHDQEKALAQQHWEEVVAQSKKEARERKELEVKERQHKKELQEQAQFLYRAAVNLYEHKSMDEALEKFSDIDKLLPDYRATRGYIARIGQWKVQQQKRQMEEQLREQNDQYRQKESALEQRREQEIKAGHVPSASAPGYLVMPAQEKTLQPSHWTSPVQNNEAIEDQQKQAADIAALAEKSAQLFSQIADIANDSSTEQTKRKMAQVDEILNNLKLSKERLLKKLQDEQNRRQQDEARAQQEELLASKNYEAGHLRQMQENGKAEALRRDQKEKQDQLYLVEQQKIALRNLAEKATEINDEIIQLSKTQDFEAMKAKFTELENTVTALTTLKNEMDQREGKKHENHLAGQTDDHRLEMIRKENYSKFNSSEKENIPKYQSSDVQEYKKRELNQEQNMLYAEGVDCFKHNQFPQAKLLFEELVQQHDRRADKWLKKVNRALAQEILRGQIAQEKERTAFLADQVKAQRELIKIQERERQRQKQLSEELERQKRLFEDERSMEIRKEETMKAQESERQLQEEKRSQLEKESEKEQETYRFHKIGSAPNPSSGAVTEQTFVGSVSPSVNPQQQAQLEVQRAAVRKQLEDGVESMYQEALGFYKQGNYSAAVTRFKDVQDIIPGYKDTGQYLDDSLQRAPNLISPSSQAPAPSLTRQDSVTKALDFFDSNAK